MALEHLTPCNKLLPCPWRERRKMRRRGEKGGEGEVEGERCEGGEEVRGEGGKGGRR